MTLRALATATGYLTSTSAAAEYDIDTTSSPVFTPGAGLLASTAATVALSTQTAGATVYYTTDGSTPTESSAVYSAPIAVSQPTTVKAMAVSPGRNNSPVVSASYTLPVVDAPTFGSTAWENFVTLASTTPGAVIHYTLNGTTPTETSTTYVAPFPPANAGLAVTTVKAIATKSGWLSSAVVTASYPVTATPTFSPAPGSTIPFNSNISIGSTTPGALMYFTLDGSAPAVFTAYPYTGPFGVRHDVTVRAIATAVGYGTSAEATATYHVAVASAPTFTPGAGLLPSTTATISLASATPGATIRYTVDGTTPSSISAVYTTPIVGGSDKTIKAFASAPGYLDSSVATASYTVPVVAAPVFASFTSEGLLSLTCATSGAVIRYTTDGTTPTGSSAAYSAPFSPLAAGANSVTVKAIATKSGMVDSPAVSATYGVAAAPTFTPGPGSEFLLQSAVALGSTTPGADVYYTTDGSTPTASSTRFAGSIQLTRDTVLKAIAIAPNFMKSAVASGAYLIARTAAPNFAPDPGVLPNPDWPVVMGSVTPGAVVYFTTDNSVPTKTSSVHTTPIRIENATTFNAFASSPRRLDSSVVSASYSVLSVAAPEFGLLAEDGTLSLTCSTPGAVIHYTIDSSRVSSTAPVYSAPFRPMAGHTAEVVVRAMATKAGWRDSAVVAHTVGFAASPTLSPAAGALSSVGGTVSLESTTPGATLYYTTDGTTPTRASSRYTSPIAVTRATTIKALASSPLGYVDSAVATASYTLGQTAQCGTASVTCARGVVAGDNGLVSCGAIRRWACQEATGAVGVDCSVANPTCPADGGVTETATGRYVLLGSGTFTMGSPPTELGRTDTAATWETQHQVTLTRRVYMQEAEVTQAQWTALAGNNPSRSSSCGGTCPVENVNWWDALAYANAASARDNLPSCYALRGCTGTPGVDYTCTGVTTEGVSDSPYDCQGYRLPMEAEWEYAYRAGTTTSLYNGNLTQTGGSTVDPKANAIAWYRANSRSGSKSQATHPVKQKAANAWGLYDMAGNVEEWCWDVVAAVSSDSVTNPSGPMSGNRSLRGGSYDVASEDLRAAYRWALDPNLRVERQGLRLARTAPSSVAYATTAAPTVAPTSRVVSSTGGTVSLASATPGATIYYTTNSATPTRGSTKYTGPISVVTPTTIRAFATAYGFEDSATASTDIVVATGPEPSACGSTGGLCRTGLVDNDNHATACGSTRTWTCKSWQSLMSTLATCSLLNTCAPGGH